MKIVFYDGECGFCQGWVRLAMRADRRGLLKFAPLQGETAARHLSTSDTRDLNSIVFYDEGRVERRFDAIAGIARTLGWKLTARLIRWIPSFFYDWVAKNRKTLSRAYTCPIPSPEERARLLP